MQAVFYERIGAARDVLQSSEWPDPSPAAGEVRVRLRWSGVNPSDAKTRAGMRTSVLPFPRIVPHSDGMGVIDAVGAGVASSRIGERVWVWNAAWDRAFGTAAQYVVLPQAQAVLLPPGTPDEAGACLGIPALTAMHAVLALGGVAGRTVLVAGGAGAVGHYAIQFAKLLGAHLVIATVSSPAKAELARAAGADLVIDYRLEKVTPLVLEATQGRGVDRVIEVDIAANALLDIDVVRPGGEVLAYGSGAMTFNLPFGPLISKNITLAFFIVYKLDAADRERAVSTLNGLLESGLLIHNIGERLPLADIALAHEHVEQGQTLGNVVLAIP